MRLSGVFQQAWLELTRERRLSLFFILNLSLGLLGFFLLQIFQQSLVLQSQAKAQVVLGGDISISARRAFTDSERESWEKLFKFQKKTHFYGLFSMLRADHQARLTSVGIFDSNYPLYGEFKFSGIGLTDDKPRVWVDPEIAQAMNLQIGGDVSIGDGNFTYSGVIVEDPSRLFRIAGLAPRALIHQKYLAAAHLLQPGSTFNEYWTYKLSPDENLTQIKNKIENLITDPVVRIENTIDSADDSNRVLRYFGDYLGLVALIALGLCFICSSYLLNWSFLTKKRNIAILKTLGQPDSKIILAYIIQSFLMSVTACLIALLAVRSLQPLLQVLINVRFHLPLQLVFSWKSFLQTSLVAIIGPFFIMIPQLLQVTQLNPAGLFQNIETMRLPRIWMMAWYVCGGCLFGLLAFWQSHSLKLSGLFTLTVVGLIIVFQILNTLWLKLLEWFAQSLSWPWCQAFLGLSRRKSSAGLIFTTMSLATLVLSLLPHIKSSLLHEIRPQQNSQIPSLFLFDIQPDQVEGLQKISQQIFTKPLVLSPLVRSRILKINDQAYERTLQQGRMETREADEEARFRNRGVNLTYRDHLQTSESVSGGQFVGHYSESNSKLPEISVEKRYAERVGLKLNDIVSFDVQGLELKARVGSLRRVRWTSFQPNFFILFPAGVLEEAPQIFLTSVSSYNTDLIQKFQLQVADQLKNISIIDVATTVKNSIEYIDQMSLALQFMAWLALLVGLFVFVVLLNTQIRERLSEMNLLQILGAAQTEILKMLTLQFALLIVVSVFFGILAGAFTAWLIISYFFDIGVVYDTTSLFSLLLVLIPVCALALWGGLRPLKSLNPMDLIRQS